MANISEEFELGEITIILVIIAAVAYGVYWLFSSDSSPFGINSPSNPLSQQGGAANGLSTEDNSSIINRANSYIFGGSSEGYTQALDTTLSSPIATLKSIFGIN